jgi:hypothetical protein
VKKALDLTIPSKNRRKKNIIHQKFHDYGLYAGLKLAFQITFNTAGFFCEMEMSK